MSDLQNLATTAEPRLTVRVCAEHGHQVGIGDHGELLCKEGHEVRSPITVEVVRRRIYERDIFKAVHEAAEVRALVGHLRGNIREAASMLSPGMRAGTAEAKALLLKSLERIERGVGDDA